jgi:hypothetical protein
MGAPFGRQNSFTGQVVSSAFMGDRLIYQVQLAAPPGEPGPLIRVTQPNLAGGTAPLGRGDRVQIGWDAEACMLLRP